MSRRFTNATVTLAGRVGHPVAVTRKLVPCTGVTFEDRWEGKKWTYRRYEAYPPDWPEMDVWTVQSLLPVKRQQRGMGYGMGHGIMVPVPEAEVPYEVKAHALAELVKLRLKGTVRG